MAVEKGRDTGLDGIGLFFESSLPRGEEENKLRVRESSKPFDGIIRVEEKIPPDLVFEGS